MITANAVVVRLDKAVAATLRVNLFETLDFLPLLDHTHVSEEEANHDRHETVNSAESIIQCHIGKLGDGRDTEIVQGSCSGLIGAGGTPKCNFIGSVEITTALQRILNQNLGRVALCPKYSMVVIAFMQGEYPDICAYE